MQWEKWSNFGWQGLYLRIPSDWNLGRVTGDRKSGYARLDDAEIVRAELEWRETKSSSRRPSPISQIVDRYVDGLEKKARKSGTPLTVQRQAKFLKDKTWLAHSDYRSLLGTRISVPTIWRGVALSVVASYCSASCADPTRR